MPTNTIALASLANLALAPSSNSYGPGGLISRTTTTESQTWAHALQALAGAGPMDCGSAPFRKHCGASRNLPNQVPTPRVYYMCERRRLGSAVPGGGPRCGLTGASVTTPIPDAVLRRPRRADRPEIVRWAAPREHDRGDDPDHERATGNPKHEGCVHGRREHRTTCEGKPSNRTEAFSERKRDRSTCGGSSSSSRTVADRKW
jgi:hypothetical protein